MWCRDGEEIPGLCYLLKENCSRVLQTISLNATVENQNSRRTSTDSCYGPYKGINNLDIKQRLLPVIKVWYRSAQLGRVISLRGAVPEWRITGQNGDLPSSVKKPRCCNEGEAKQGSETSWEELEATDAGAWNCGTGHPPDTKKVLQENHCTERMLPLVFFWYYLHYIHI